MNSFGRKFRVTIFGESHGDYVGVTLDGVVPGIELSEKDFSKDIIRRKTGEKGTSPRKEKDEPIIISGLFAGLTTGAPLTILFKNNHARPCDYTEFKEVPRPGHADFAASQKYDGFNDLRGGGHFSGRLTLPIVAAGVVAKKILDAITILDDKKPEISAKIVELGGSKDSQKWDALLDEVIKEGDSLGAVVECRTPIDAGYGEPFWDSVESLISHAIFAIPGVRGIEFGDGFRASAMRGSEHNDPYGHNLIPTKNGAGGVNGGITNGAELCFRVAFKPTSSISKVQKTYNIEKEIIESVSIKGRHDACFALRTPVVVEAMTAIVLLDLTLLSQH